VPRRDSLVLFVHGAHLAGWCWLLVMERLGQMGIESHAIDLPFTGYADDVAAVRGRGGDRPRRRGRGPPRGPQLRRAAGGGRRSMAPTT
jgi:hypothetical protein